MSTPATKGCLTGDYALDAAHTRIRFAARHAVVSSIQGCFDDFEGGGAFDAQRPSNSRLWITIKVASIDTGDASRDAHLRSIDFFDADLYPYITFVSTSVEQVGESTYSVTGDLTVKNVTKPITIAFHYIGAGVDPFGDLLIGFEGSVVISRKDWGVNWSAEWEVGGLLVSDQVKLEFQVCARKLIPEEPQTASRAPSAVAQSATDGRVAVRIMAAGHVVSSDDAPSERRAPYQPQLPGRG